jgi:hypothetical protein
MCIIIFASDLYFGSKVGIFFSSLRVAELVWREGVLIKEFPPEAYTIKNIDDAFAFLKTDDGQKR